MCMEELVDQHFPNAECCVLVEDNLNTHNPAALYETFAPAKARGILNRLELHFIHCEENVKETLHIKA